MQSRQTASALAVTPRARPPSLNRGILTGVWASAQPATTRIRLVSRRCRMRWTAGLSAASATSPAPPAGGPDFPANNADPNPLMATASRP
jgi:hypothetical protein